MTKKVNQITAHKFEGGKLKLSKHDKKALELSTIWETSLTIFIDQIEMSIEFKKDQYTKDEFIKILKQSKMILGQVQNLNEKLLNCLDVKEVEKAILKSYKLLKSIEES